MGSLIVRAVSAVGMLGADGAPSTPSTPVQIGTPGARHGRPEMGSWQMLILMFISAIVLGTLVLMYVVRQRGKVLARRRVRRMAEYARLVEADVGSSPAPRPKSHHPHATPHHIRRARTPRRERVT